MHLIIQRTWINEVINCVLISRNLNHYKDFFSLHQDFKTDSNIHQAPNIFATRDKVAGTLSLQHTLSVSKSLPSILRHCLLPR